MKEPSVAVINSLVSFFRNRGKLAITSARVSDWLMEYYCDCFSQQGVKLVFTSHQKRVLRAELEKDFPSVNWLKGISSKLNRIEVSEHLVNEKQAGMAPNESYLSVKTSSGDFRPYGIDARLLPEQSLRIPYFQLDPKALKEVVIVENLAAFDHWYLANIPNTLKSALIVYRGNGAEQRGIKSWLSTLPDSVYVTLFTDLDPAGAQILLTTEKAKYWLVPEVLDKALLAKSQSKLFLDQHHQLKFVNNHASGKWKSLIDQIGDMKLAITQEHLLFQNTLLTQLG